MVLLLTVRQDLLAGELQAFWTELLDGYKGNIQENIPESQKGKAGPNGTKEGSNKLIL